MLATLRELFVSQSQLRTKLAMELQNSFGAVSPKPATDRGSDCKPKGEGKTRCAMSTQVANSIIAEHMKRVGFEYSLSVFLPEAGLNTDKVNFTQSIQIISGVTKILERNKCIPVLCHQFSQGAIRCTVSQFCPVGSSVLPFCSC